MALADKVHQLDHQIATAVRTALGTLRRELDDRLRQSTDSLRERIDGIEDLLPSQFLAADDLASLAREESAQASRDAIAELAAGIAALDQGRSQTAILNTLLERARHFASRTALFLTPNEAARGWQGQGFGESSTSLAEVAVPYEASAGWSELASGRGWVSLSPAECADLASRLECPMAREAALIPLVLADQVAAALYADLTADRMQSLDIPALQALTHSAAAAIESLPFRHRQHNPTFEAAAGNAGEGLPLWTGPSAAAAAEEPRRDAATPPVAETSAPTSLPLVDEPIEAPSAFFASEPPSPLFPTSETAKIAMDSADHEPWEETAAEFFSPAPSSEPEIQLPPLLEPEPLMEIPGPDSTSTAALPAFTEDSSPLPWPEPPAMAEPDDYELPPFSDWTEPPRVAVEEPPAVEPIAATLQMPEVNLADDATILIPRRQVAPPSPPPPIEELDEEATHPGRSSYAATRVMPRAAGGSAEVRPPSGIEGPGLAFSWSKPQAAEPAGHEEARRLARLLVSEIRLYNEDLVEEGRRNRDIYARLRDEIDRSRKMYDERISADVRTASDYFTEELVRRLADGDPGALGI